MRHFLCVTTGLDVLPLVYAISRQAWLWDMHPLRTQFPGSPHAEVSDILCRFQQPQAGADVTTTNADHECVPYPAWHALPELLPLVFGLAARIQATRIGRVLITNLRPGCTIPSHIDSAPHSIYYLRHHIVLCSPQNCYFQIEDEMVQMRPGECWKVRNDLEHSVVNDGPTERWSLIVDLHCDAMPLTREGAGQGKARRPRAS